MLSATTAVAGSFSPALLRDFEVFGRCSKVVDCPDFAVDPHFWTQLVEHSGRDFCLLVDHWLVERTDGRCVSAVEVQPVVDGPAARGDAYLPHVCELCDMAFSTKQGRGVHKRMVHGCTSDLRAMAWGSRCPQCEVEFHSRPRLLQHLGFDAPACRAAFLDSEPLMLEPGVVETLNERDRVAARANKALGLPAKHAAYPAVARRSS